MAFATPYVTCGSKIILAELSVAEVSDLNNKPVAITGLNSISETDVNSALAAAGAMSLSPCRLEFQSESGERNVRVPG
jgi:hypothetical protein